MNLSSYVIKASVLFLFGILMSDVLFCMLFGEGFHLGRAFLFLGIILAILDIFLYWKFDIKVWILLFLAGILYFQGSFYSYEDNGSVPFYLNDNVNWKVQVVAEVDVRRTGQKLTVKVVEPELKGRIMINTSKFPQYLYGDYLYVNGLLEEPFETEDFSYKKYLLRFNTYGMLKRPKITKIDSNIGNPFFHYIFRLKVHMQGRINQLFTEPYASFESGLLLGARKGIPDYILEAFNITGLTHIIAISGYNISLVIVLVSAVFSGLKRKTRVIASFIFVVLFTILVGMSAAVVRAAIMGSIGLFAIYFGRSTMVTLTLIMSALLMNLYNPKILPYDVGFQLSFAATCGIVYVAPKIKKWFVKVPDKFGIREGLHLTIAAQISTLPIILFHFGRLSLVSPLANVFTAPLIPLSMASGSIAYILSYISQLLSDIFVGITWVFLELIIQITLFCARIPYASIELYGFDVYFLCIAYLIIFEWCKTYDNE